MANVTSVHKKDNKQTVNNYSPISLLLIFAKVFEQIIFEQIIFEQIIFEQIIFEQIIFEQIIFKNLYNHLVSNNLILVNVLAKFTRRFSLITFR